MYNHISLGLVEHLDQLEQQVRESGALGASQVLDLIEQFRDELSYADLGHQLWKVAHGGYLDRGLDGMWKLRGNNDWQLNLSDALDKEHLEICRLHMEARLSGAVERQEPEPGEVAQ